MKARLKRLKGRFHEGLEDFRSKSDQSESLAAEGQMPGRIEADFQQSYTRISQQEDRAEVATDSGDAPSSVPQSDANRNATDPSTIESIDVSSWVNVWPEAYEKVNTDPEHSGLLQKLQTFLVGEVEESEFDAITSSNDPSVAAYDRTRLESIQKNAEERLKRFSEAHLSFKIRDQPIVVRESILKAVQVINTLKPIISGAVAAEPSAALAWAGVTTILPILENVFQQDEDAATGLTNIIFLMARYQGFHEADFTSQLASPSESGASQKLLSRVRDELVSVYGKIYIYEARFILHYGKRNKAHRALRNALSADEWKKSWSEIEAISHRIDKGIATQVNAATLGTWKAVKDVQEHVTRLETMQKDFDRRQLLQSLRVTGNAIFDSDRRSRVEAPCLPGTQRHILQTIQEWTEDPQSEIILWLEGMAGTGKTSIALTVATALEARTPFTDSVKYPSTAVLGASFFFSQGDATRNNTAEFFRTIGWCLADMSPEFGSQIAEAIKHNPGIQTKVPVQQLEKLILGPLTLLDKSTFLPLRLVLVVDALDECDNQDAEALLSMLEQLKTLRQVQLRFLITSRREGHISTGFKSLPRELYRRVELKKVEATSGGHNDINLYLSKTFCQIAERWGIKDNGVTDDDIESLAVKADGLFIYAATTCRFLDSSLFANKKLRDIRLSLILEDELEKDGPQERVDDIYLKVLAFPDIRESHKTLQDEFYQDIIRVIGFIVVLLQPASVETLFYLLPTTTEASEKVARENLDGYLSRLNSILNVPENHAFPISLVHLSFRDFILDSKRSEKLPFSIDEISMHREVLHQCFAIMNSKLREDICCLSLPGSLVSDVNPRHISSHIPQYLQYACRYWVDHLIKANHVYLDSDISDNKSENTEYQTSADLVVELLKERFLYWLEIMAFIGEASSIISVFIQLDRFVKLSTNPDLSPLVQDAKRFVLNNRWIIEHTPLQMYCSALIFCPKDSLVRYYYQKMIPVWITKKPATQQTWPVELCTLQGHTDEILDTAFSPTETLLGSVSADNTTRVWDYVTGSEKYRFEDLDTPMRLVAACSNDFVALCNVELGQLVQEFLPHKGLMGSEAVKNIHGLSISADNRIVAVRFAESVDFWEMTIPNPKLIRTYKTTWSAFSSFLFISADSMIRICQTHAHMVDLFDLATGDSIGTFSKSFVKQHPHDGPLHADLPLDQNLIRILSGPTTPTTRETEQTTPENVELLHGNNMALSYSSGMETRQWNATDKSMKAFEVNVRALTYSPDRVFVLLQLESGDGFQVWDKTLTRKIAAYEQLAYLDVVPQTCQLVSLSLLGNLHILSLDPESLALEAVKTPLVASFGSISKMSTSGAKPLYVSPNGEVVAVILPCHDDVQDQLLQLWNIPRREKIKEIRYPHIRQLVFPPDSRYICVEYALSTLSTQFLQIWNGTEVEGGYFEGASITFHPSSRIFAIISERNNTISVWEGMPWVERFVFPAPERPHESHLAFSTTNKLIVSSPLSYDIGYIIDVWDTTTRQKVGSQSFKFKCCPYPLRFVGSESFLDSSTGRFPLPTFDAADAGPDKSLDGLHTCLYVLDDWVYQGHERLIWLPPSYRPPAFGTRNIAVQGDTIVLAYEGNCVRFIGISLVDTPVAKHYLELGNS
ncbi:WD40 repeat protein [Fusarium circinatum]|uniref:WD40 repeat protein n=1 Tax=Fusarium circinatum TaxID=48490 RepID=A0A8H5U1F2_FUSCI|nr:WD40 repeat protein [Fusarium circinatum]